LGNLPLRQGLGFLAWLMALSLNDAHCDPQRADDTANEAQPSDSDSANTALSTNAALGISQRLRLPNGLQEDLAAAMKLTEDLPGLVGENAENAPPSLVTTRLDQVPPVALYLTYLFPLPPEARRLVEQYRDSWRNVWPARATPLRIAASMFSAEVPTISVTR